ncbi:Beta-galactosidase 11 [Zea mays]|uniref:Beta-galactosidase n=1 Tax=Zea mays TaxID=4577 RepID=A0A1D6EU34_MAIZE|nr:Beta-galactosidase 11 [Zea mays]
MTVRAAAVLVATAALALLLPGWAAAEWSLTKKGSVVTYDGRSLMIDGKRDLFFSGAIHYPRSPPEMWPKLIERAKEGGLNTIETYIFWNAHEPEPGKYNFEGRFDLIKYLKMIQEHDMYAIVRIGPFIQAEWNHGGLPYWLREIDHIIFRANNDPYKKEMEKFVRFIVQKLKDAELFASQGGPIILTQIENEYGNIKKDHATDGDKYLEWAAQMALSTQTGVPWIMCKQSSAPGEVIPTCNGRHCGDTWTLRDKNKPMLWTENWTQQFRAYGDQVAMRSAEDIAYAVLRFFAKGGSLVNYYMYHGGTNFGRTGASYVLTGYYDEAPMDEYGMYKEPKFGHLRDLHNVIRSYQKAFLWGQHSSEILGHGYEVGNNFFNHFGFWKLILLFDSVLRPSNESSLVFVQHSERSFHTSDVTSKNNQWEMFSETIPKYRDTKVRTKEPLEQYNQTKDDTDYLWYTTSFRLESDDLPFRNDIRPVLQVKSSAHAMMGFANDAFVGCARGNKQVKGFMFEKPVDLKVGVNHVVLLSSTMGMKVKICRNCGMCLECKKTDNTVLSDSQDSGGELAEVKGGIQECLIQGLNTGTLDLQVNGWGHKAALEGEYKEIYSEKGLGKVQWKPAENDRAATWYKRYFDEPDGDDPVVLDMSSMSKGMIFVNGEGVGRYWVSYRTLAGTPSQAVYHIPRPFLKSKDNLLVIFEEEMGKPDGILVQTVTRDDICLFISEHNPGQIKTWDTDGDKIKLIAEDHSRRGTLTCPPEKTIQEVVFASFGNPDGMCGNFTVGTCHTPNAKQIVEKECLGKPSCMLPVDHTVYGADINCQSTTATLGVQVRCGGGKKGA